MCVSVRVCACRGIGRFILLDVVERFSPRSKVKLLSGQMGIRFGTSEIFVGTLDRSVICETSASQGKIFTL